MINIISAMFYKILYMSIIGTVISVIVATLIKIFDKKLSAKYKCFIWIIALLFFIVPFAKIPIKVNVEPEIISMASKLENTIVISNETKLTNYGNSELDSKNVITYNIIPVIWMAIGMAITTIFIVGKFNLHRKINDNVRCRNTKIKEILQKCKQDLNINKKISVRISKLNKSPYIYGFVKPQIIIPEHFVKEDEIIIENVFRHELSHYKRKDMITNYLLIIMTTIHWFNPFVYFFFKKIRQEMELATDELSLKYMNKQERKMYGMTLIGLLQTYGNERKVSKILCITDTEKNMEKRIRLIKNYNKKIHKNTIAIMILVIMTISVLPFIVEASNTNINSSGYDKKEQNLAINDETNIENDNIQEENEKEYYNSNNIAGYNEENLRNVQETIPPNVQREYVTKTKLEEEKNRGKLE